MLSWRANKRSIQYNIREQTKANRMTNDVDENVLRKVCKGFVPSYTYTGLLTEDENNRFCFNAGALKNVDLDYITTVIYVSFKGVGTTTPGFPNCSKQKREKITSPYMFNCNGLRRSSNRLPDYSSEHVGQERTPKVLDLLSGKGNYPHPNSTPEEKNKQTHIRIKYIGQFFHKSTLLEVISKIKDFEFSRQRSSRILSPALAGSTQKNELGELIKAIQNDFYFKKCNEKQEREYKYFPPCAIKRLLPFLFLDRQGEFLVQKIFSDEKVTIFDFIRETDGWARRTYKKNYNEEYPFLTDKMVNDILMYSKDFLSQKVIDELSGAIL